MIGNYKIVTLCGSTRFKREFLEVQKRLTLEGNIVIQETLKYGKIRMKVLLQKLKIC